MKQKAIIYLGIAFILLIGGVLLWKETLKAPIGDGVTPTQPTMPTVPTPPIPTQPTTPTEPTIPIEPQTPEGWKTYENKEFGFAFDYPGDWELEEERERKSENYTLYNIILIRPGQKDIQMAIGPTIYVYANNNPNNTEETFRRSLISYEGEVKAIKIREGIQAYFLKDLALEYVDIFFLPIRVSFISQHNTSLNMDIVNTFRLIK